MSFDRWLQNVRSAVAPGRGQRHARRQGSLRALGLESLEDRRMLAFAPIAALPVDPYPVEVASGDFNNDGRVDLVAANDSGSVSMQLGNGDGSFQPGTASLIGPSSGSLAVGDFNADGNLDLAAATYGDTGTSDNDVGILLGHGDGTFADAAYLSIPSDASSLHIAVGDIDGDDKPDLVVNSYTWSYEPGLGDIRVDALSVLLGNGDGDFTFAGTHGAYWGLSAAVVADVNSDGYDDVAAANPSNPYVAGAIEVFLGNSDGTLSEPSSLETYVNDVSSLVAGDFNADGKTDLAALDIYANSVSVLQGNDDGTFQTAISSAAGELPFSGAAGEFNGDGMLDLIVTNGLGGASVLLGNGDGSFAQPITTPAGTNPAPVVVDDFNADGRSDAAVADYDTSTVLVMLNDGIWPGPNTPEVQIWDEVTVTEGNAGTTDAVFTVNLTEPSSETVTVDYITADSSAQAGSDYAAVSGTLTFAPGETSQTIAVPVLGDTVVEPLESFAVILTSADGAIIPYSPFSSGTGWIVNDDSTAQPDTYTSTGDPKNIGDNKTVSSSIDISGTGATVGSLTIQINLTHARQSDLTAQLVSSTGITLDINGPIVASDYDHAYDVSGATGLPLDGTWTLQVSDNVKNRKRGKLIEWSMDVAPQVAATSPESTATDLALLSWFDSDPTDDDESDLLTESLVDDLALMLV